MRILLSLVAGLALYVSSPPRDLWWLAPLALAVWAWAVHGRGPWRAFGFGLVFGVAYLLPLLGWLYAFLGEQFGPWPWLAVVLIEALFFGCAGAAMAIVSRLPGCAVWMALMVVLAEALRARVPLGGFPWAKIAYSQAAGPYLPLAALGGTSLVTFAVAASGTGVAALVIWLRRRHEGKSVSSWVAPSMTLVVPIVAGLTATPLVATDANAGVARVAIVQGDAPDIGLGLLNESRTLYLNHLRRTEQLAADVRAGRIPKPDLVVLPESTGTWGPDRRDPGLESVAGELGVPVAAGGTAVSSQGVLTNRIIRWDPDRRATDEYVKQQLVPFGEYLPLHGIAPYVTPFAGELAGRDMVPGSEPGVFSLGPARVGLASCYDIAYDYVLSEATRSGATLLAVPSNNAWYGRTEMTYQQLGIARMRAVENGRAVLVAANSGVSAIVQPDGRITRQTGQFTAGLLVADVPLRSTMTVATRLGAVPEWMMMSTAAAVLGWAGWRRSQSRSAASSFAGR